jgi:hypothetical protein
MTVLYSCQRTVSQPFWEDSLIYQALVGDQTYGLDLPHSTPQVHEVRIPLGRSLLGPGAPGQWTDQTGDGQVVTYALAEFVRSALACEPAPIELLYTAPRFHLFVSPCGQKLLDHRRLFLSMRARHTFGDDALSQLRRIEQHRRWLTSPPDRPPSASEFSGRPVKGGLAFPTPKVEKAYRAARTDWEAYQRWRQHLDPPAVQAQLKCGYDTVLAMHMLRRLAMAAEILETGLVHVYRHDRTWLRSVRDGALSYTELLELVAACEARLDRLCGICSVPDEPDYERAEALVSELQEQFLQEAMRS